MQLRQAERKQAKIKLALTGPSGSGKTYSSLLIAYGMTEKWNTIAVIDTENRSADLYAHLGNYNVISLEPPFTPEKYIEAIKLCEKANMEVIIIDSITHCWEELLQYHSSLQGNSYFNWSRVTPMHKQFINSILNSRTHIICTMRVKQDYVIDVVNGKNVPTKVGLKAVQRDGTDYEFTITLDLDMKHNAQASKDRTSLFTDRPPFKVSEETGKRILNWCNTGTTLHEVITQIGMLTEIEDLRKLYKQYPEFQTQLEPVFIQRKEQLLGLNGQVKQES